MLNIFQKKINIDLTESQISSLVEGEVIDIHTVSDPVFASESMGPSVAIRPNKKMLVSPVDGEICMSFPTQHALGIRMDNGVEILIHIGINTVELNGMGFKTFVQQGDRVKRGDKLIKVDFNYIKEQGFDETIMFIITNSMNKDIEKHLGKCKTTDVILTLKDK